MIKFSFVNQIETLTMIAISPSRLGENWHDIDETNASKRHRCR